MRKFLFVSKLAGTIALFLALIMTVGIAEEKRTDASGVWCYVLEDGGATITGSREMPPEDLVFPSELDGYPVTAIDMWVSDDVYITSVTIPDSVTRIGAMAFSYYFTGFSSITIPDSITSIGNWAFYCCELTSVTIPASVVEIDGNPFDACPMEYIDVAADNPVYEQVDGVLFDKGQKMLVVYPGARKGHYTIPEEVLHVGDMAFTNCEGLTGVIIPDSVTSIGESAFWGCTSLTSVTIPDGVTDIGDMAFDMCDNLTSVIIPDSVISIGDWAFGHDSYVTLRITRGSYAELYAEEHEIPYEYIVE